MIYVVSIAETVSDVFKKIPHVRVANSQSVTRANSNGERQESSRRHNFGHVKV
jgi:hypothetical protein